MTITDVIDPRTRETRDERRENRGRGVIAVQIVDVVIDASADDAVTVPQLVDHVMPTRTIEPAEAQHAGLGEAG